jgi:hypothetical protein
MGTIKKFEDSEVWQLARELLNLIYDDFRNCKDYNFKDQVISAGLSIKTISLKVFPETVIKNLSSF